MSRTHRRLTLVVGAALLVAPVLAAAQPGRGAPDGPPRGAAGGAPGGGVRGRGPGPGAVTHLLNARRDLELTPRQVAQLDSIERLQFAERKAFADRVRPMRDSLVQRGRMGPRTPGLRDSLQAEARKRMEANRPLMEQQRKRDSSLNLAAERVLNDTQRQKVREMQAERRGYERGMREGRGGPGGEGGRGARGGQRPEFGRGQAGPGAMRGPQGGVRGPQGPGGQAGPGRMPPRPPVEGMQDR